jgi:hypothetical protein
MNDQARQKLCELVADYGKTICDTPRTCMMVLGQQCAEWPTEKQVLIKALERGTVAKLKAASPGQEWDSLTSQLANGSGVSAADARWAVESWAMALGKHPDASVVAAPKAVEPLNAVIERRGLGHKMSTTLAVAIGGGIGGAFTAMLLFTAMLIMAAPIPGSPGIIPAWLAIILILIGGASGGAGGLLGGGGGWMLIQAQSSSLTMNKEDSSRLLRSGFIGAFTGALTVTVLPGYFLGIVGLFFGGLLGGFGGAITGGMSGAAGGTSRNY